MKLKIKFLSIRLFILFALLTFSNVNSQNSVDELIVSREKIHMKNDSTIVSSEKNKIDLTFLCENLYDNYSDLFFYYHYTVFRFFKTQIKKTHYLKQWKTPIVVYFDAEIPESIVTDFRLYFNQIKEIKNLKIVYTDHLEKANFFINISKEKPKLYKKNKRFKTKEAYQNYPLTNFTYNLLTDGNNKFYGGILTINIEELKNETLTLKKLKQVFFVTLGNFSFLPVQYKDNTLLSSKSDNVQSWYNRDLGILKIHYGTIYGQKVNSVIFKRLKEIANNDCNYE